MLKNNTLILYPFSFLSTAICYNDRGRFYQGSVNVTRSGIPCQSWSQQVPHQHRLSVDVIPELKNSDNHCRNPGGISDKPWCYTSNPNIRWEYCAVPQCGEMVIASGTVLPSTVLCSVPIPGSLTKKTHPSQRMSRMLFRQLAVNMRL